MFDIIHVKCEVLYFHVGILQLHINFLLVFNEIEMTPGNYLTLSGKILIFWGILFQRQLEA